MPSKYGGYEDQPFVAEFYDYMYADLNRRDIEFFVDYSRKANGRTLELGCGSGRVLIPTAIAGCDITGLDLSPFMLQKCGETLAQQPEEVQKRVKLVQGDMTRFDLHERFVLVTIPFRPFQHLISVAEQKACLNCIAKHLVPGGSLILDVFQPFIPRIFDPKFLMETEVKANIKLPDGRIMSYTNRTIAFHREEQYNDVEFIFYVKYPDGRQERLVQAFPIRYFYRYEMEHLLSLCGFKVVEFFGKFDRSKFTAESPEMIFVAEKVD